MRGNAATQDAPKAYVRGTHRTTSPEATLANVRPFLNDMGITRIANVTGLDRIGVPVVTVMRPNSRSLSVSQGKGIDLISAKASGVMEAVESYHAERIDHPLKLGSYRDLAATHRLVEVDRLPRLRGGRFQEHLSLLWIEGRNLLDDAAVLLPFEMVHTNYTVPAATGSGCFVASTNGLASGNHILEAIAHGIAEVIERDANTLWNMSPQALRITTRIDPDSVDDPDCIEVLAKLGQANMAVGIWNMTSDTGVPSFYCLITDGRSEFAHSGAGAGSHPAREIALLRALTEAVQVRTNYITGARDDLAPGEYEPTGIADKLIWANALMSSWPDHAGDFRDVGSRSFDTLGEDVDWMLERLRSIGITEVIMVDLTRPEFGLPVARVVIPGLEGPDDHDDFEPGTRALAASRASA